MACSHDEAYSRVLTTKQCQKCTNHVHAGNISTEVCFGGGLAFLFKAGGFHYVFEKPVILSTSVKIKYIFKARLTSIKCM